MNSEIVTKVLIYAASSMSPLIATKIAHMIALVAGRLYATALAGKPLPPLTDVVLVKFASSNFSLGVGLALTIFMLIAVARVANPTRPNGNGSHPAQIFLAFVGPFISAVYLAVVLIATLLPLTPMGHVLTKSVEQAAEANP